MRSAVENKTAKVLTEDIALELKGKKITTIYFGYKGQDHTDEFVVGNIVSEYTDRNNMVVKTLMTFEGRNTFIRLHSENEGAFTCSDVDRFVFYLEADHEN